MCDSPAGTADGPDFESGGSGAGDRLLRRRRSPAQSSQALIEAHVAEYLALRSEIEWLIKDGSQYQGFAIALLAASLPLLQFLSQTSPALLLITLLPIPFLFCLLGFLYFRQHEEVHIIAAYLASSLRPKVRALTGDPELWSWEEFKSVRSAPAGRIMSWAAGGRTIFVLRALLFVVPSLLSVCVAGVLLSRGSPYVPQLWEAQALIMLALVVDAVITCALLLYLATQGDFAGRILGLQGMRSDGFPTGGGRPFLWFADRARKAGNGILDALLGGLARFKRGRPTGPGERGRGAPRQR